MFYTYQLQRDKELQTVVKRIGAIIHTEEEKPGVVTNTYVLMSQIMFQCIKLHMHMHIYSHWCLLIIINYEDPYSLNRFVTFFSRTVLKRLRSLNIFLKTPTVKIS